MMLAIYILSLLVMGFTVAGILIGSSYDRPNMMRLKEVWAMAACAFIPLINTIFAIAIIGLVIWLLFFKHPCNHL